MKQVLPSLFFTLSAFLGWSQEKLVDSLYQMDFELLSQEVSFIAAEDSIRSKNLLRSYLERAKKESNTQKQIYGYYIFAAIHFLRNPVVYRSYLDTLYSISIENDSKEGQMLGNSLEGVYNFYIGKWDIAIEKYFTGLEHSRAIGNAKYQKRLLSQIGYIKSVVGEHKEGIALQRQAYAIVSPSDSLNSTRESFMVASHLARSYNWAKLPDSALVYSDAALKKAIKVKDSTSSKALLWWKTEAYLQKREFDKAKERLDSARNYAGEQNRRDSLLFGGYAAEILIAKGRFDEAIAHSEAGIAAYGVTEEEEGFMLNTYLNLAKAYKGKGDYKKANYYFEKHLNTTTEFGKIKDSVALGTQRRELDDFKQELQTLETEKRQQQNYLIYMGAFGGIAIVTLITLFFVSKRKSQQRFKALLAKVENPETAVIDTKEDDLEAKNTTDVNVEATRQILEGLKKLEAQQYYLKQECSSHNVAKKIKTNTSYLSKVVNTRFQKNFNTYINDLRINYALHKLKEDAKFRSFTVQSIANELGYKSADSFTKYFKRRTGFLPSFYIKKLNTLDQ